MSGGVDSSVAAYLLKRDGFDVTGMTMCLGVKTSGRKPRCCGPQEIEDARRVCQRVGISHYVLDFSEDLEQKIISKYISEYLGGRTPNPCVDCNKFLKFGTLFEKARALGFDFLATGHYAEIERNNGKSVLKKARDETKDQSYFLYPIKKEELESVIFPLGKYTKGQVREIAHGMNLPVADKPESQDICFIQDDYRQFVSDRIANCQAGDIVDKKGNILGEHRGIFAYTIGQRRKLGLHSSEPLYVISIDAKRNRIMVGKREDLYAQGLMSREINLLVDKLPGEAHTKIRYRHKEAESFLHHEKDRIRVIFKEKQPAVTPGQSTVFYKDDLLLGGGVIDEVIW